MSPDDITGAEPRQVSPPTSMATEAPPVRRSMREFLLYFLKLLMKVKRVPEPLIILASGLVGVLLEGGVLG